MSKVPSFILAAAVLGLCAFAHATEAPVNPDVLRKLEELEKEVKTLRHDNTSLQQEVKGLRGDQGDNWLNDRRAEEVKSLIHEVLADADTRASLLSDGATAGYDGHFFIASADNKFRLNVMGQMQFRYEANFNQPKATGDEEDEGFTLRRGKVQFGGHIMADKKIEYYVSFAADREGGSEGSFGSGSIFIEDYWARTTLMEHVTVQWGKFKLPFLREELVSSKRQLAVERSSATEFFTLNRAEQVQFGVMPMDNINIRVSLSDGAQSETSDIGADGVEFAITARVDAALAGDLKQADDFAAWSGEPLSIVIGGAIHYQLGDAANAGVSPAGYATANYFSWTIDGSVEVSGFNLFVSFTGGHIDSDSGAADRDMYGILVQGGYMVIPDTLEPYARFEWIDNDTSASAAIVVTFGVNYYMKGHNAKFTLDIVWLADGADPDVTGNPFGASAFGTGVGGADGPMGQDEILLRAQFQLLF